MLYVFSRECGLFMKEQFANERELHFELYRHLKNWIEGVYGEESYSEIVVKPEMSNVRVHPELPVGRRFVSADLAILYGKDNLPYLTVEVKHEKTSSQDATHVEAVTQAFRQGFYLFPKYVITFTENEFCLFEFADNQELGEAVAMEDKWLTPKNIRDVLLKRVKVTDLKKSAKQILDIVKNDFAKEV